MAFQHTYIPTINHGLDEEMHAVCFASLKKNERKIIIKKSYVLVLHYISNRKIYIQRRSKSQFLQELLHVSVNV